MALSKVTYVDGVTIIGAKNLNDIQDELIRQGEQQTEDEESMATALALKADKDTTYTKTEVDSALALKADKSDTYTKAQVDASLALKADKSDTYTKAEVDSSLALKADKTETYTKAQVDSIVEDAIAEAVKESEYSNFEMKSVSGDFIHITDGAGLIPVKDLKIGIDAVQDLHGYDAPWVGGAEKNKFNPNGEIKKWYLSNNAFRVSDDSSPSIAITVDSDETIKVVTNTSYRGICFNVTADSSERVFSLPSGVASAIALYSAYEDDASIVATGTSTALVIPANTAGCVAIRFNTAGTYTFKGQLEAGSTASDWTPYSNICPISGWTGAKVTRLGKNWFNGDIQQMAFAVYESGAIISLQNTYRGFYAKVIGGETYTISRKVIESNRFRVCATVDEPAHNRPAVVLSNIPENDSAYSVTVTVPDDCNYLFVYLSNQSANCNGSNYQVALENESSEVEPYNGHTYEVTWQDEAGTVYGGMLDVTNGKLTKTWGIVDFGDCTFVYNSTDHYFYTPTIASLNNKKNTAICTCYKYGSDDFNFRINANNGNVILYDSRYNDADVYKTAMTGQKIVYELAEPVEYDITAVTDIVTLLGENNIFADTGAVEELIYRISRQ